MQKYFEEQPTTRPEQVAVVRAKLKARFKRRYPTLDRVPRELLAFTDAPFNKLVFKSFCMV